MSEGSQVEGLQTSSGFFVPADAVTNPGAHLPPPRLRRGLNRRRQFPESLRNHRALLPGEFELDEPVVKALEIELEGAVEAPVARTEVGDALCIDGLDVAFADLMGEQGSSSRVDPYG